MNKLSFFGFLTLNILTVQLAQAGMKPPPNICSHIKENVAYQTMNIVKPKCDASGVNMSEKQIYDAFNKMLTNEEASPSECNLQCMIYDTLRSGSMGECVDTYAKTFANTIGSQGSFNANTCADFKSRFVD